MKPSKAPRSSALVAFGVAAIVSIAAPRSGRAAIDFYALPHINRIAFAVGTPDDLLLATRAGVLRLNRSGKVEQLALGADNVTLLQADPQDPRVLYASGRSRKNKNSGLLISHDGANTWAPLSPGAGAAALYRAMATSNVDPNVMYASYGGLQASRDRGRSWDFVARGPWDLYDLAASARDLTTLYAASRGGLLVSTDAGLHWRLAIDVPNVATAVTVGRRGTIYAYVAGRGLIRGVEPFLAWRTLNNRLGEQMIVQLLVDGADQKRLIALNQFGRIIESRDAGLSWHAFGGDRVPASAEARHGAELFRANCRICHGERGTGEVPSERALSNPDYLRAPALDDSTHAWHHDDEDLKKDILEGSEPEPRMRAFKNSLSAADARDLVAYIKSLWGAKALSCQGARHMTPECRR